MKKKDLEVIADFTSGLNQKTSLIDGRVQLLEKSIAKEDLRKEMDVLYGRLAELESRTKELEDAVLDNMEDLPTAGGGFAAAEQLEWLRAHLATGMPVHVGGLAARADLNGHAGTIIRWGEEKRRWHVYIGSEAVLIRVENLFP